MLLKASIEGMTMDAATNTPIILLKTEGHKETIPIWIGLLEATSIAAAMKNIRFDRPMTHDLFHNFAQKIAMQIEKVVVTDIIKNTYYARIYFSSDSQTFDMDARPSDAIALALRFKTPIFIEEIVIEKSVNLQPRGEVDDSSEEGQKWADYLNNLSAEDFGKYKM